MIGTIHSELGPPTSIINQGNVPTDMSLGQSDGDSSSIENVPSSQMSLVYVKLIKYPSHLKINLKINRAEDVRW